MKSWMWWVVALIIIIIGVWYFTSAKTAGAPVTGSSQAADFGTYPYECDEHVAFTMTPASDMSTIALAPSGSGTYPPATVLTKMATSSGALYQGGGLTFYGRGESVSLTQGTQSLNCSPVPNPDLAPFNFGD
jgi:membrane-bound inhibitor of C-type lysozyme